MVTEGRHEWFADVPAWPTTGDTPARALARALADARLVTVGAWPASPIGGRTEESPSPPDPQHPETSVPEVAPDDDRPARAALSEEDLFEQMRVRKVAPKGKKGPQRFWKDHRGPIVGAAAAALVVGVAAALAISKSMSGDDPTPKQVAVPQPSATSSAAMAEPCPSSTDGAVTTGRDAGDQRSGPGVIKAFNHAYYIERSATRARAVSTPNAVASRDVMQKYIDQRPRGTEYCLSITARGRTTYDVVLTETPPDPGAVPIVYRQTIQTVEAGGKTWISSIKSIG
ncbi:hypothetical protein G3I13_19190 [Streptomyces sp. SID6673]|nr:hypothetical protein [Streptomyces sp. SID11726]NEB26463.1 hypothetical protein [Streptomyces sp. SID6673]